MGSEVVGNRSKKMYKNVKKKKSMGEMNKNSVSLQKYVTSVSDCMYEGMELMECMFPNLRNELKTYAISLMPIARLQRLYVFNLFKSGRIIESLNEIKRVIEIQKESCDCYALYGLILLALQQIDSANKMIHKSLDLNNDCILGIVGLLFIIKQKYG